MKYDFPHGFVLSESALYAYSCQDVYDNVIAFAAAIPDHLKPLFLIPIQMEIASTSNEIARSLACSHVANSADAELFGTSTFVNDDPEPTIPSSEPGSIFRQDDADSLTHHQEYDYDQNIQAPTNTTFMSDVLPENQGFDYPYNTKQRPTHSSNKFPFIIITNLHVALKPDQLETHAPKKVRDNAKTCIVSLTSYDPKSNVFTFSVDAGNGAKSVQAKLSEIDQVSMSCNCPFWRWNGPEYHAKENSYMLDSPFGSASPPNVRDPDRKYWLCKHAYAVLKRLDNFVQEVIDENWDQDEDELLQTVENEWDRLEGAAKVPLEETEDDDIQLEVDWDGGETLESDEVDITSEEDDGSIDVDLSDLEDSKLQEESQEEPPSNDQEESSEVDDYETSPEIEKPEPEPEPETREDEEFIEDYEMDEDDEQIEKELEDYEVEENSSDEDYEVEDEKKE